MKGVGPKFAEALHALGIDRFEQLARLTPVEIERLDAQLGPFRGRHPARPGRRSRRIISPAATRDGFEERFGKL